MRVNQVFVCLVLLMGNYWSVVTADDSDESGEEITENRWPVQHNESCTGVFDCVYGLECMDIGTGSNVCRCRWPMVWDSLMHSCTLLCQEYCEFWKNYTCTADNSCVCMDEFQNCPPPDWAHAFPEHRPFSRPLPLFSLFGLIFASVLLVLLVWKCTVHRRMNQLIAVSRAAAAQRSNATPGPIAIDASSSSAGPTIADDPPKYHTVIASPELRTETTACVTIDERQHQPAASAPTLQLAFVPTVSGQVFSSMDQRAPVEFVDSPPPYDDVVHSTQRKF